MSIASEITRLQSAKSNIRTEIINKGVTVPSTITLDQYPSYIASIPTGGTDELFLQNLQGKLPSSIDIELSTATNMRYHALAYNKSLVDVTFKGSHLPSYFEGTFDNCIKLQTVTLSGMSSGHKINLGNYAFQSCRSLTSIPFANNIYLIGGSNTFAFCTKLSEVNLPNAYFSTNSTTTSYTFQGCSSLTTVNLSSPSCTNIPNYTFTGCSALSSISIPNVTSIGTFAFWECSALSNVYFPKVTYIGSSAFYRAGITSIDISSAFPSLTSMGTSVFAYCSNLSTINFNGSLSSVPNNTCWACTNLTNVSLGTNVQYIGTAAFLSCANLTTISFPSSLLSIYADVFRSCTNLESVYIPSDVSSLISLAGNAVFAFTKLSGTGATGTIYVPSAWLASYKAARYWSAYSARMSAY